MLAHTKSIILSVQDLQDNPQSWTDHGSKSYLFPEGKLYSPASSSISSLTEGPIVEER